MTLLLNIVKLSSFNKMRQKAKEGEYEKGEYGNHGEDKAKDA